MPLLVGVNAVSTHGELRVDLSALPVGIIKSGVEVNDAGDSREFLLCYEPAGVAGQDVAVVVLVDFCPGELPGSLGEESSLPPERERVKGGRAHENQGSTCPVDFFDQGSDAFLVLREAFLAERIVDPVIHAVAGEDQIRPGLGEGVVEPGVNVGAWKGVGGLGEAGAALAGQAEVDELGLGMTGTQGGFQEDDEMASSGDGISQENDPFCTLERICLERDDADQGECEGKEARKSGRHADKTLFGRLRMMGPVSREEATLSCMRPRKSPGLCLGAVETTIKGGRFLHY